VLVLVLVPVRVLVRVRVGEENITVCLLCARVLLRVGEAEAEAGCDTVTPPTARRLPRETV
jgi:hypothetical protein